MAKNSSLNNSVAYGFSQNVVRPIIINTLKEMMPTAKVEATKSTNDVYKPISITIKEGRSTQKVSVVIYYGGEVIALSLYNMMYAENIAFIANGIMYVVNGDVLRSNWKNILTKTKTYIDGSKISSEMTYADINKVINLAVKSAPVSLSDMTTYKHKAEEYKIAC